jgi:hypothetical protein
MLGDNMNGNDNMIMFALAMVIQALKILSVVWFIVYVLLGSLVKVVLIRFLNKGLEPRSKRFWPVFLSHFLFSIIFVNLYTLYILERLLSNGMSFFPLLPFALIYFIVLPVMLDILFLRIIPRIKLLRWLLWIPPLKQVIIVNVVICLVSFIAAVWVSQVGMH